MEKCWNDPPRVIEFKARDYENIWAEQPHLANHIELMYVLEGKFTLVLSNDLRFPAVAGDFLLVPAFAKHRDVFEPSRGLRVLLIHFDWKGPEEFFTLVNNRTLCDLDFAARAEAMRRIDFMYDQWEPDELGKLNAGIQLHGLLMHFYTSMVRSAGKTATAKKKDASRRDAAGQILPYAELLVAGNS